MNIYKETSEKSFIEISHDKNSSTPTEKKNKSLTEHFSNYNENTKQNELWSDTPIGKEVI